MRSVFLVMLLLAGATQAETITIPPITHVKLDDQYYVAGTQLIIAGDCAISAPGVEATQCRRANSAAQVATEAELLLGPSGALIYVDPEQDLLIADSVLIIGSSTGDIVCEGAVPQPPPNEIFTDGME